jgi:hypothetical protein
MSREYDLPVADRAAKNAQQGRKGWVGMVSLLGSVNQLRR